MGLFEGWYELEPDGTTRKLREDEVPIRDIDHRRIAETTVGELWVSTVFLGLDHSYLPGPPILFETMVFPNRDNLSEQLCWRYHTRDEAAHGHAALVAALEVGTPIDEIDQPPAGAV